MIKTALACRRRRLADGAPAAAEPPGGAEDPTDGFTPPPVPLARALSPATARTQDQTPIDRRLSSPPKLPSQRAEAPAGPSSRRESNRHVASPNLSSIGRPGTRSCAQTAACLPELPPGDQVTAEQAHDQAADRRRMPGGARTYSVTIAGVTPDLVAERLGLFAERSMTDGQVWQ